MSSTALLLCTLLLGGAQESSQKDVPDTSEAIRRGENPPPPTQLAPAPLRELSGEVIYTDGDLLLVEHAGAVVQFEVTPQTQIRGTLLMPGDEVRARFIVDENKNVVTSVSPAKPPPAEDAPERPIDVNKDNPSLVPDTGEMKGPASPVPGERR